MSTFMKPGLPWLYDETTGDIVGVKDADGGDSFFTRTQTDADGSTSLLGPSGEIVHSTPIILGAVPTGIPSSGVVDANGALTVSTAFLETYSDGCWLYFPANAVYAGSLAGLYWVVMSSTTAGTIYDNLLTLPGSGSAPTSLTPIVAAGGGAYTQTLAEITVAAGTVPGGAMGGSGVLQITSLFRHNSSSGSKSWNANFGGTNFAIRSSTTTTLSNRVCSVYNRGSTSRQVSTRWVGPDTTVTTDPTFGTVDTTADQVVSTSMKLSADTDWVMNLGTLVTVTHGD